MAATNLAAFATILLTLKRRKVAFIKGKPVIVADHHGYYAPSVLFVTRPFRIFVGLRFPPKNAKSDPTITVDLIRVGTEVIRVFFVRLFHSFG